MANPHLPGVFVGLAPVLDHYGYVAAGGLVAEGWFDRHGGKVVVLARFIEGLIAAALVLLSALARHLIRHHRADGDQTTDVDVAQ